MSEPWRIGMIGCGTVGSGVAELIDRRYEDLERVIGRPLEIRRIVVRDPERPRHHLANFLPTDVEFTADPARVTSAEDVDLVVEVAGGTDEPRRWILAALENGKDVITANKAVLAFHGAEIFKAVRETGRRVYYEASVAGAIPIVEILQNALVANQVTRISAILNGTCNYILTRMEEDGLDYARALELAQEKGFAEAEPSLDVGGGDTAHKLALLAGIICDAPVPVERIYTEGIEGIAPEDIRFANDMGYRVKLLAIGKRNEQGAWELRVHPTLVPQREVIAQVQDEFNAVSIRADAAGPLLIHGKGAGALPTASSVVADLVRAARGDTLAKNGHGLPTPTLVPIDSVELRHYIRVSVLDVPGVLGRITSLFGLRQISISSIHQSEARIGYPVPIVLVTHKTVDRVINDALRDLERVQLLRGPATRIRIED